MRRADKIGILLSLLAVVFSYWIAWRYYENLAHLEDEMAYVWQAEVIARGHLTTPSPAQPDSFLWPFVVDYNGQRFGKYPPGWPALLAVGERFGQRDLVNPLLAGLAIWLIYRLGKRTLGENIGLLASALTLLSPFFLVNSASLLSHPFGLVLSAGFALAWLEGVRQANFGAALAAHANRRYPAGGDGLNSPIYCPGRSASVWRAWVVSCWRGRLVCTPASA